MARWQDEPQRGQTVWRSHQNGKIVYVDYSNRMVMVNFYDHGYQAIELDIFFGSFDEKLNQWILIGD